MTERIMHRIRQLCQFVDDDTLHTLVHALILSRLDYCLLAGCTLSTLHHLQHVQDTAARLVCGAHALPLLKQVMMMITISE